MTHRVHLFVHGASADEIEHGEAAILKHFEKAGCSPVQAAEAGFQLEAADDADTETGLTDEQHKWAVAWFSAEKVGLDAIGRGEPDSLVYTNLVVDMGDRAETLTNAECSAEIDRLMGLSHDELVDECRPDRGPGVKDSLPFAVREWRYRERQDAA